MKIVPESISIDRVGVLLSGGGHSAQTVSALLRPSVRTLEVSVVTASPGGTTHTVNMNTIRYAIQGSLHPHSPQVNRYCSLLIMRPMGRVFVTLQWKLPSFPCTLLPLLLVCLCCGNCVDKEITGLHVGVVMLERRSTEALGDIKGAKSSAWKAV